MDDRFEVAELLDFYGPLLTEHQRTLMKLYFNEDLSYTEIAEEKGISRQSVCDAVHRAKAQLLDLEKQLGLVARHRRLTQGLQKAMETLDGTQDERAEAARSILTELLKQEEE